MVFLALSHQYEWNLTLSRIWAIRVWTLLKNLLLRSFHTNQTANNQMSWRKDLCFFEYPVQGINWLKWLLMELGSTPATPNQDLIYCHKELNKSQWMNKWDIVSSWSHPTIQLAASCWMMPHLTRLFLVGNLSCNNLHAKIDNFRGTCLCLNKISQNIRWSRGLTSQDLIRSGHNVILKDLRVPLPPVPPQC